MIITNTIKAESLENKTAYVNSKQFSRLYNLASQRFFLHQHVEKKLIQGLKPIQIQPEIILNLGADLTLENKYRVNFNNYTDLYQNNKKLKTLHILPEISTKTFNNKLNANANANTNTSNIKIKQKFSALYKSISNNLSKLKFNPLPWNNAKHLHNKTIEIAHILDINTAIATAHMQKNSVDIIYSNLTLNYYTSLASILNTWKDLLKPNGLILFSMFGMGTAKELENLNIILPLPDMHNIGDILLQQGFINPVIYTQRFELDYTVSNIQALLLDLHAFGLLFKIKSKQLSTSISSNINGNIHTLKQKLNAVNKISIEIIYAHAWYPNKINTLTSPQSQSIIQLDKLYNKIK